MTTVFFDLETGGLRDDHPNIQIAAVAVDRQWNEVATFERKIKFNYSSADPEALALNHYSQAVWFANAVDEYQACTEFASFLEQFKCIKMTSKRTGYRYMVAKLAGHNAATFDGPRLKAMFNRHNLFLPADPRVRCTVQQALWWFDIRNIQPPQSFKLGDLCKHFGIPCENAHESLADVRMTIAVARKLSELLETEAALMAEIESETKRLKEMPCPQQK